jgi:hypothetical protein
MKEVSQSSQDRRADSSPVRFALKENAVVGLRGEFEEPRTFLGIRPFRSRWFRHELCQSSTIGSDVLRHLREVPLLWLGGFTQKN